MKILLLLTVFLVNVITSKNQYIIVEHVGVSDSIIDTYRIFEGKKKYSKPYETIFYLDKNFSDMFNIVSKFKGYTDNNDESFGTFKITFSDGLTKRSRFLNKKQAVIFFKKLISFENSRRDNKILQQGFIETLRRIYF